MNIIKAKKEKHIGVSTDRDLPSVADIISNVDKERGVVYIILYVYMKI